MSEQRGDGKGGQAGRVATVGLLCAKLDGAGGVAWVAVLSPLALVAMAGLGATLVDVRRHRRLKARGKTKVHPAPCPHPLHAQYVDWR
jgi:hypothetical protein